MDAGTIAVAAVTLALFVLALFLKGFTHDILLEAAVFLVSVKLMIMAHKTQKMEERLAQRLDDIAEAVRGAKP